MNGPGRNSQESLKQELPLARKPIGPEKPTDSDREVGKHAVSPSLEYKDVSKTMFTEQQVTERIHGGCIQKTISIKESQSRAGLGKDVQPNAIMKSHKNCQKNDAFLLIVAIIATSIDVGQAILCEQCGDRREAKMTKNRDKKHLQDGDES